jgi:hypothetical protein
MLYLSRRFRLLDVRVAATPDCHDFTFRFHEPFDASGAFVAPGSAGPRFIRVSIFPSESAPSEPGNSSGDAILESTVEAIPPRDVFEFFQSVIEARFPRDVPETPDVSRVFGMAKPGDPIDPALEVSQSWMPKAVVSYVDDLYSKLTEDAQRVGDLFRWVTMGYLVDGRVYSPLLNLPMWSLNGSVPRPILPDTSISITLIEPPLAPRDAATEVVQSAGQSGQSAPITDALIREAWRLRKTSPRAAVVLAIAATEVSKQLRQLPPTSTSDLGGLLDRLHIAERLRNNIVHQGSQASDTDAVDDALAVASDFVRLGDYYAGNEWALAFVSEGVRLALTPRITKR